MSATDHPESQFMAPQQAGSTLPEFNFLAGASPQTRLTPSWGRTVALGWFLESFAFICIGASSQMIGRPVIWLDDQRWNSLTLTLLVIATCFPMMAVALWSLFHGPLVGYLSFIPTAILVVLAILDRHSSPGSAVVTLVLAVAGALLTVGAFAGRYRLSRSSSSVTASN